MKKKRLIHEGHEEKTIRVIRAIRGSFFIFSLCVCSGDIIHTTPFGANRTSLSHIHGARRHNPTTSGALLYSAYGDAALQIPPAAAGLGKEHKKYKTGDLSPVLYCVAFSDSHLTHPRHRFRFAVHPP